MSDLISRIAARAVGAPALARPHSPNPIFGEGGLEVVDEDVATRVAAPSMTAPATAAAPATTAVQLASIAPHEAVERTKVFDAPPAAASPRPAAEARARDERHLPGYERATVDPTEEADGAPAAEPQVVAQAMPVAAVPAAEALAAPALPAHRWATPAHGYTGPSEEPPPVRVHIGRLEVRANLHEQLTPAAPALPQPAEPEGLSLSDYLRGRR